MRPPKFGVFSPKISLNGQVSTRPPKGTSLHDNTCFGSLGTVIWRKKSVQKKLIKPQVGYISPHHTERVANLKLYPLRQTRVVIRATNFQLDPPNGVGSMGGRSWGSPVDFPNDSYNRDYLDISNYTYRSGDIVAYCICVTHAQR